MDLLMKTYRVLSNPSKVFAYLCQYGLFNYLPDEIYLKLQYRGVMGKKLNLKNPKRFNEKLQWLKIYDKNPRYTNLVDKYEVRTYIAKTIGEEYLIPLLGVWDNIEEIDFSKLPNQFVLKCTHDSGGVIICKDKNQFNITDAKKKIKNSFKRNFYNYGREWPYKNVKPRIICEQYMVDETENELKDYKFMCFNGEPKIIQVMSGRNDDGQFYINHYDLNWNRICINRKKHKENTKGIRKPYALDEMVAISKELSKGIPFVRIDLYLTKSGVYFGEMTFFPVSGFMDFEHDDDDYKLGSWISLANNDSKE